MIAGRIERALSKREILEQYLNRVYYGNGAWGAEAAARFYFGKPAAALSLGEASFLAVLPRGPEAYDPFRHFDAAIARRRHILGLMQEAGLVTAGARDVAERTPLVFRREHPELRAPHFVEHVLAQLGADERAGATIETTLDGPLQQRLEIAVRDHLEAVGGRGISQAGVVVIRNRDGAVLAMVGSRDYFDARHAGAVNVTTIRRRPGSTLKPFVYGAGAGGGRHAGDARVRRRAARARRARPTRPRSSSTARPATASRWPARTTWRPCTRWRGSARRRWSTACAAPA